MRLSCIFAIVAIALTSCRTSKEYIQSTTTTTKRDTILIEKSTYIKDSTFNKNDTIHHFRDRYIVNNIYKNIYRDSIRTDTITKTPPTKKCDKKHVGFMDLTLLFAIGGLFGYVFGVRRCS